ncbi:hypothetical protein ALC53_04050 [Atta colombica]|uniref:Uncharacterized protein n=1 Tax=Atta colombica TaxID=520822 RepID=A0A195BN32_9HYME|nr:hypothetical protein ALC53_04050 [Atta colombica]
MPPKRQGRRAEFLLASPTAPEYLVFVDRVKKDCRKSFSEAAAKAHSEAQEYNLELMDLMDLITNEGGPIVLRARGFRKISALTGVTTPVTLFVPEKQQRPRPNAAPTFPPTAFAIKQKPLEIEFVRKVKRSDRLLGFSRSRVPVSFFRLSSSELSPPRTSAFRFLSATGLFSERMTGRALENQFTE